MAGGGVTGRPCPSTSSVPMYWAARLFRLDQVFLRKSHLLVRHGVGPFPRFTLGHRSPMAGLYAIMSTRPEPGA